MTPTTPVFRTLLVLFAAGLLTAGLSACDDKVDYDGGSFGPTPDATGDASADGGDDADGEDAEEAERALRRQAAANISEEVVKYVGEATIEETVSLPEGDMGYVFDPETGPVCIDGSKYFVSWRDGERGSKDVILFMQGGGACWSTKCLATGTAGRPGYPGDFLPIMKEEPSNPYASYNKAYLPYCDGSLFAGDAEYDDDVLPGGRIHHGLQNLSAGIDVIKMHLEKPERILITGMSAGGFGTILATNVVRKAFPEAEIEVFNDSGVGVLYGDDNLEFLPARLDEWNITPVIPESCDDCTTTGHITPIFRWQLDNDPTLRIAAFSNLRDGTISGTFLDRDPVLFQNDQIEVLGALSEDYPGRFAAFLPQGTAHTVVLSSDDELEIDDVELFDWLKCFHEDLDCFRYIQGDPVSEAKRLDRTPDYFEFLRDLRELR